jgi:L-ribulose-5-phosphate 4-epimerase
MDNPSRGRRRRHPAIRRPLLTLRGRVGENAGPTLNGDDMLDELRRRVCQANKSLVAEGLVAQTWGNVSGLDRKRGRVVIKPSGVPYAELTARHMVVLSLADGEVVEGKLRPSSDAPTHLVLYRAMEGVGAIVHTHSLYATAWAQSRRGIPALGTTHADYFHGPVPCTRVMTDAEIQGDYEVNTGKVIVERMADLDPHAFPGALVADHGAFAWGDTPEQAVEHAAVVEHIARLAAVTMGIDPYPTVVSRALLDKHYLRKHGPRAYYGQK